MIRYIKFKPVVLRFLMKLQVLGANVLFYIFLERRSKKLKELHYKSPRKVGSLREEKYRRRSALPLPSIEETIKDTMCHNLTSLVKKETSYINSMHIYNS